MNRDTQGCRVVRLRTLFKWAGILLLLTAVVGLWKRELVFQQVRAFFLGNAELTAEKYGWQLTQRVDAVEVFEIADSGGATNAISIRLGSRTEKHEFVAKRALTGADAKAFLNRWGRMRFHWGLSGLCHSPGFVVRFLKDGKPELETTVCFLCHNFPTPSVFGDSQMMGFDQKSPAGQAFVAEVRGLFPNSPKWAALEKEQQKKAGAKE